MKLPALLGLSCLLLACNSGEDRKTAPVKNDSPSVKKEVPAKPAKPVNARKPPIINIVDTITTKKIIVYMKDSASSFERISLKLAQVYGVKLAECFKKNGLKSTGPPMAWYLTRKAPYFFEAGIPVNKKPLKLTPGVKLRELGTDSAVIAHFYGPYDLISVGYDALDEWMKDHHKRGSDSPYESYISDPIDKKGKPLDPYKVQTDIIFPRK